jgi:hypothetical protein
MPPLALWLSHFALCPSFLPQTLPQLTRAPPPLLMISFDEFSVAVSCDLLLEMLLWSHPIYRALAHLLGGSDEAYLQMSESTIKEQIVPICSFLVPICSLMVLSDLVPIARRHP